MTCTIVFAVFSLIFQICVPLDIACSAVAVQLSFSNSGCLSMLQPSAHSRGWTSAVFFSVPLTPVWESCESTCAECVALMVKLLMPLSSNFGSDGEVITEELHSECWTEHHLVMWNAFWLGWKRLSLLALIHLQRAVWFVSFLVVLVWNNFTWV